MFLFLAFGLKHIYLYKFSPSFLKHKNIYFVSILLADVPSIPHPLNVMFMVKGLQPPSVVTNTRDSPL
jgi:hypothetical protein